MSPLPTNRPGSEPADRSEGSANPPVGPLRPRQNPPAEQHSFAPRPAPQPAPRPESTPQPEPASYATPEAEAHEPAINQPVDSYDHEADEWADTPPSPFTQEPVQFAAPEEDLNELSESGASEAEEAMHRAMAVFTDSDSESARLLLARIMDDESTEVLLNGPTDILCKISGQRFSENKIKFSSLKAYHAFIDAFILTYTDTSDRIATAEHLIEGLLEMPSDLPNQPPLHARVHALIPPVTPAARVTIAKKAKRQYKIRDLQNTGSMTPQMAEFIKALARGRATIVLAGLSGSGKTTLLEAMSHEFDVNERVLVAEDTAELRLPLDDVVSLLATSRKPGQESSEVVTLEWIVAQANRMRPDRIIVGESRGSEFGEFLSAANSGADGSMTTIHASSARQAIDKMVSLTLKSGTSKSQESVLKDIAATVQIIIQAGLIDGKHIITEIEEVSNTIVTNQSGQGQTIATSTLFRYNRSTNRHEVVARASDRLTTYLAQRGVKVEPSWFRAIG